MKYFILGIFCTLLSFDVIKITTDNSKEGSFGEKLNLKLINPGLGMYFPITGKCSKQIIGYYKNDKVIMRDYFQCNKLQIFISDFFDIKVKQ